MIETIASANDSLKRENAALRRKSEALRKRLAGAEARADRLKCFAEALISQAFQGRLMKEQVYRSELERAIVVPDRGRFQAVDYNERTGGWEPIDD